MEWQLWLSQFCLDEVHVSSGVAAVPVRTRNGAKGSKRQIDKDSKNFSSE